MTSTLTPVPADVHVTILCLAADFQRCKVKFYGDIGVPMASSTKYVIQSVGQVRNVNCGVASTKAARRR